MIFSRSYSYAAYNVLNDMMDFEDAPPFRAALKSMAAGAAAVNLTPITMNRTNDRSSGGSTRQPNCAPVPAFAMSEADGGANSPRFTMVTNGWGLDSRMTDPPPMRLNPHDRVAAEWMPNCCGLYNLGNTCYLNAALQCLVHTTELSHEFIRGFFAVDLNGTNDMGGRGRSGKLAEAYNLLVEQTHCRADHHQERDATSVNPHYVKRRLDQFRPQFVGLDEHDSCECLTAVLDGVHEALNRVTVKPPGVRITGDGSNDMAASIASWAAHQGQHDSVVVDLFHSQMRSQTTCGVCSCTNVNFEPSVYLSVAFPPQVEGAHDQSTTLAAMLSQHFLTEGLTGNDELRLVGGSVARHDPRMTCSSVFFLFIPFCSAAAKIARCCAQPRSS